MFVIFYSSLISLNYGIHPHYFKISFDSFIRFLKYKNGETEDKTKAFNDFFFYNFIGVDYFTSTCRPLYHFNYIKSSFICHNPLWSGNNSGIICI